jgi:hypothetical protein
MERNGALIRGWPRVYSSNHARPQPPPVLLAGHLSVERQVRHRWTVPLRWRSSSAQTERIHR